MLRDLALGETALDDPAAHRYIELAFDRSRRLIGLVSRDGRLLRANPALLDRMGASASHMLGHPIADAPWWRHQPKEWAEAHQAIERCNNGESVRCALNLVTEAGDRLVIDLELTPINDHRGRVELILVEAEETTDARVVEDELRDVNARLEERLRNQTSELLESRERIRAVVDTAADAIITIDHRGTINSFNRAAEQMFGYTADEVVGTNVKILMPEPYRAEHDGYMSRYLETHEAKIIGIGREATACRKDGSIFPIELAVSEIDHFSLFAGIIRDISDRKDAEERLRSADRLSSIGTLAAGLGHDMSNILLPMRARLDIIEASDVPEEIREHFSAIRKTASYLQDLSDGLHLLALNPDDAGASTATTSVNQWWEQVHSLLARALPKHVRFSASLPSELPSIPVAPHRLTQAVLNMLVNSGSAVGEDGRVRLWAEVDQSGGVLRLAITDNGSGMETHVMQRALEPFFTTKTRGLGTGLGLSLVHSVVTAAGGAIDIDSRPGEGTTIMLSFPIVLDARPEPAKAGPLPSPRAGISINDTRTATLARSLLEMAGFDVVTDDIADDRDVSLWIIDGACPDDPIRSRIDRDQRMIAIGPMETDWDETSVVHIEDPNDFDTLKQHIDAAAQGVQR